MSHKKLFAVIALTFALQYASSQVKWEVKGGINYSNIPAENRDGDQAITDAIPGIYLGLGVKIRISDHFFLNPAIIRAKRGFNQDGDSEVLWWGKDLKVRTSYVELPVDLLYSPKVGPGNLLIAAGPYAGYGSGGKWTTGAPVIIGDIAIPNYGTVAFQNDNSYRDDRSYVYAKAWDYGVHFKVGYALFNQYSISLESQRGIANLQPRWGDFKPEGAIRNKAWGVLLSYTF